MKRISMTLILLTIFTFVYNPKKSYAHGEDVVGPILINGFVGYQCGIGTNGYVLRGFDSNIILAFLNGGYSNKYNFGSNAYIGVGFGSILQIQYGYAYSQKKDLLRVRTDIPLSLCSGKGIWRTLTMGLYWEKRVKDPSYSNNFGLSLTIGIMNLIWSPEGRERTN